MQAEQTSDLKLFSLLNYKEEKINHIVTTSVRMRAKREKENKRNKEINERSVSARTFCVLLPFFLVLSFFVVSSRF